MKQTSAELREQVSPVAVNRAGGFKKGEKRRDGILSSDAKISVYILGPKSALEMILPLHVKYKIHVTEPQGEGSRDPPEAGSRIVGMLKSVLTRQSPAIRRIEIQARRADTSSAGVREAPVCLD